MLDRPSTRGTVTLASGQDARVPLLWSPGRPSVVVYVPGRSETGEEIRGKGSQVSVSLSLRVLSRATHCRRS